MSFRGADVDKVDVGSARFAISKVCRAVTVFIMPIISVFFALGGAGCAVPKGSFGEPVSRSFGACSPTPCAKVEVSPPRDSLEEISDGAADRIFETVRGVLYAPFDEDNTPPSEESVAKSVERLFTSQAADGVTDAPIDWVVSRKGEVLYKDSGIVSILVSNEGYIGGAHGFSSLFLASFDAKDGSQLTWSDCVVPESMPILLKIAEAEFRRVRDIKQDQSLERAGFSFPGGGDFVLPDNFALSPVGIRMRYNSYEVAPFSYGPTDILIPIEVASPLLKPQMATIGSPPEGSALIP